MTSDTRPATPQAPARPAGARRELTVLLVVGVLGAGLALLAARQELARVVVTPPRQLPVTVIPLSWQDLLPGSSPLAVAALASMAAVLATRGLARRITGVIGAALGVGIAILAAGQVSSAAVISAATHASISAAGAVGGTAPGSTTAGNGGGQGDGVLTGFPAHVLFSGSAWRWLMLLGAALIVAACVAVTIRAVRLPAMSARYERSGSRPASPAGDGRGSTSAPPEPDRKADAARTNERVEAARMWESLTAGGDPTVRAEDESR